MMPSRGQPKLADGSRAIQIPGGHMFSKRLVSTAVVLASVCGLASAQSDAVAKGNEATVVGKNAVMTVVTEPPASFTRTNRHESGLVTIFSNLASQYPNGEYWCCTGYNIMGPSSGAGEQWIGAAFTPGANHTVTKITVAVGFSQGTTNGAVLSLRSDNNGVPGMALKSWTLSNLPFFGTCCTLVAKSTTSGISVSGGKQYWVVVKTNSSQLDTVDGWNVDDTDQVNPATLAVFPGNNNHWNAFQATPGVAFAVEGSN
jgi:hypothetical protein